MKKTSLLLALLLCSSMSYVAIAADSDIDAGMDDVTISVGTAKADEKDVATVESDEKASEEKGKDLTQEAKDEATKKDEEEKKDETPDDVTGMANLPNGTAYVGVYSYLNLRDGVWGNITNKMYNNEEVTITGRDGDWYKVSTSKGDGYLHARYVFAEKDKRYYGNEVNEWDNPNGYSSSPSGSSNTVQASDVIINVDGDSVQGKVVNAAKQIHDKYQGYQAFPYDPLTEGGNLGCAQVATTVLKAAGVLNQTCLNCTGTISLLEQVGWSSVTWPPYQAGDVVFWETYQPGPSHVGIVMNSGNSAQAMNNSSSKRMPQYSDITSMKICKIMRKL